MVKLNNEPFGLIDNITVVKGFILITVHIKEEIRRM
jgi:hypothetical protein